MADEWMRRLSVPADAVISKVAWEEGGKVLTVRYSMPGSSIQEALASETKQRRPRKPRVVAMWECPVCGERVGSQAKGVHVRKSDPGHTAYRNSPEYIATLSHTSRKGREAKAKATAPEAQTTLG